MIVIEQKKLNNSTYFYLSERVRVSSAYKKIQSYLGFSVPKDLAPACADLQAKETKLTIADLPNRYDLNTCIVPQQYAKAERSRLIWKYHSWLQEPERAEQYWTNFAIEFIYESNALEGSKLSRQDVKKIVKDQKVKKSLRLLDVQEAKNSIAAFRHIRSGAFKLNQNNIKALHAMLTHSLGIPQGYKQLPIIVNNKQTVDPKLVRGELTKLIAWYKQAKKSAQYPLLIALDFHQRFEYIHPFSDGNGRVGRLILIWMLLDLGYGPLLIKKANQQAYFSALDKADEGRRRNLYVFMIKNLVETMQPLDLTMVT